MCLASNEVPRGCGGLLSPALSWVIPTLAQRWAEPFRGEIGVSSQSWPLITRSRQRNVGTVETMSRRTKASDALRSIEAATGKLHRLADQLETTAKANREEISDEGFDVLFKGAGLLRHQADLIDLHANRLKDLTGARRLVDMAKTGVSVLVVSVGLFADGLTIGNTLVETEQSLEYCSDEITAELSREDRGELPRRRLMTVNVRLEEDLAKRLNSYDEPSRQLMFSEAVLDSPTDAEELERYVLQGRHPTGDRFLLAPVTTGLSYQATERLEEILDELVGLNLHMQRGEFLELAIADRLKE